MVEEEKIKKLEEIKKPEEKIKKPKKTKKTYTLVDSKTLKDTGKHNFTVRTPRNAAWKAANRGYTTIYLRERARKYGDKRKRIHVFEGSRKKVPVPESAPIWLKDKKEVWFANIKKIGIIYLEKGVEPVKSWELKKEKK